MFGADAGIVEACGNGIDFGDVSIFVLAKNGFHAVEDADGAFGDGGCMVGGVHAFAAGFASYEGYALVLEEGVEGAGCVGAAAYAGVDSSGKAAGPFQYLGSGFTADAALEVANHSGKGAGPVVDPMM